MDQERVREALNKHFYGETDHFEAAYRVKGKDDNWVWILDRAKIVERDEKDNALRMTGTIKNISQFKQKFLIFYDLSKTSDKKKNGTQGKLCLR